MDKRDERILKLLYRSLDAPLRKRQQARLDRALAGSGELRRQKDEIVAMRTALAEGAAPGFRPGFADRTLARLRTNPAPEAADLAALVRAYAAAFRPVAVAGLVILAVLVTYNLAHQSLLPKDAIFYASDLYVGKLLQVPVF